MGSSTCPSALAACSTSELVRLLQAERVLRERAEQDARNAMQRLLQPRHSPWKPKRKVGVCDGAGHTDHPLVSAIVQTFGDGGNAQQLTTRLHAALPASQLEVIINDDSGKDHGRWAELLRQPNDFVVSSPNIHEIRAYNRLARLARGDFLLLLQGDHCLPAKGDWLRQGLAIFRRPLLPPVAVGLLEARVRPLLQVVVLSQEAQRPVVGIATPAHAKPQREKHLCWWVLTRVLTPTP